MIELIYKIKDNKNEEKILGANNTFLNYLESLLKGNLIVRRGEIFGDFNDEEKEKVCLIFDTIEEIFLTNKTITHSDLLSIVNTITKENKTKIVDLFLKNEIVYTTLNGKVIIPRTLNQKIYYDSLKNNDIVFAVGPAGSGKTYLAIMYAVKQLKANNIKKIILVRPAIEAGEKLGFLPGDLKEKIDPYLIPLYDALNDAISKENVDKLIDKGIIEIAPLAYMRGRTLENAIVILDEAQNASNMQMKMFLTRLGYNSKMIITGDVTQIDLPNIRQSGLVDATKKLKDIDKISIVKLTANDVMRHPLVSKIIKRYEEDNDN